MKANMVWMLISLSTLAAADSLTEADRKAGLAELERTRAGVIEATKGLSEAQWKFKPAPDRWSVAEVLEHITVTEGFLLESTQKAMQAPAGKPDRDYESTDKLVLTSISSREQRFKAPAPVQPAARWPPQETLDRFQKVREQAIEFMKTTQGMRDHVTDSPLKQPLDAYQWLLFISGHCDRHTKQILEVKADPGFPRQ